MVEYVYPLKTDGKGDPDARRVLGQGDDQVAAPDPERLQPDARHRPSTARATRRWRSTFEKNQALLDKDFQLFYGLGNKDIGLTPLAVPADRRPRTATSCC